LAVRLAGKVALRKGDRLGLAWDPADLHCFDRVTEQRRDDWRGLLADAFLEPSSGGAVSRRHGGPAARGWGCRHQCGRKRMGEPPPLPVKNPVSGEELS